jgi:hypothetical protein
MKLQKNVIWSKRTIGDWDTLVLVNLALSFYNLAVIWLMQLDVFYTWRYIPTDLFGQAQGEHFWKLFITVFPQAILTTLISGLLLKRRPVGVPAFPLVLGFGLQLLVWLLTAMMWGRWQGQIAVGLSSGTGRSLGPANYALYQILMDTHWIRVGIITAYAVLAVWLAKKTFLSQVRTNEDE